MGAVVFTAVVAPSALSTAFGPEFIAGGNVLRILAFAAVAHVVSRSCGIGLIAYGQAHAEMRGTVLGPSLGLVAKVSLTWRYGITGAAFATLGAELYWSVFRADRFSPAYTDDQALGGLYLPMHALRSTFSRTHSPRAVIFVGVGSSCGYRRSAGISMHRKPRRGAR